MKKIILPQKNEGILLSEVGEQIPIFAKRNGVLSGMIVNQRRQPLRNGDKDRWILCIGGTAGCSGHYESRRRCIEEALKFNYEFFINEEDCT